MNPARPLDIPTHDQTIPRRDVVAAVTREPRRPIALLLTDTDQGRNAEHTVRLAEALVERDLGVDLVVAGRRGYPGDLPTGLDVIRLALGTRRATWTDLTRYLRLRRPSWILVDDEPGVVMTFVTRSIAGSDVQIAVQSWHGAFDRGTQGGSVPALARRLYRRADAIVTTGPDQARMPAGHHGRADEGAVTGAPTTRRPRPRPERSGAGDRQAATLIVVGPITDDEHTAVSAAVEHLRERRPVELVTVDEVSGLERHLGGDHVVLATTSLGSVAPLLFEAFVRAANVVVAGGGTHDGQFHAGLARTTVLADPGSLATVLEDALERPLHPHPERIVRWAAGAAADRYVDLFERFARDRATA